VGSADGENDGEKVGPEVRVKCSGLGASKERKRITYLQRGFEMELGLAKRWVLRSVVRKQKTEKVRVE